MAKRISRGEWVAIVLALLFAAGIGTIAYVAKTDLTDDELIVPTDD